MADTGLDRVVSDAMALIRLRSANPPGDELQVAEWVAARVEHLASSVDVRYVHQNRANVVAEFDFGPGPTFILCTHLDVVPATSDDQWEPVVRAGRLIGRGSCDAKGSLAAMIETCRRLYDARSNLGGKLVLAAVSDEESDAMGAKVLTQGMKADGVVIGEPTDNLAVFASRGAVRLAVAFHGRSGHASHPAGGINAVYAAASLALAIERLNQVLDDAGRQGNCAATVVAGGSKLNVIPEQCVLQIDIRLGPADTIAEAVARIRAEVAAVLATRPGVSAEVTPAGAWLKPFELPADCGFARRVLTALAQSIPGPMCQGGTDAPHFLDAGIPAVILGPGSVSQAHTAHESVELAALAASVDRYDRVARAFLAEVPQL